MRIKEILESGNMPRDVSDDLMDLLMTYRQRGVTEVPVEGANGIVSYLSRRGHEIDVESIMSLRLSDVPGFSDIIVRVDPKKITMKPTMNSNQVNKTELDKSKEKVAKGAAKGADKIVKSGGRI